MRLQKSFLILFFVILGNSVTLVAQNAVATLKLADALGSNMVVQQNKPFTVWGTARPGAEVVIDPDWTGPVTVVADEKGAFRGVIPVPMIKKGDYSKHSLKVRSKRKIITLSNILIGELWICSGQSNMQFAMKEDKHSEEEIPKADNPNIRLFNTGLNFSDTPIENVTGKWMECTPETVKDFSAVGYYFGKYLQAKLDVPVGLLFTGIGASAAQAYVPKEVLKNDKLLDSVYLRPYLRSERSKEKIDGGFSFEKVTRPYLLYNAMIHPFRNLSIKGISWYQGESNRNERGEYTHLMYAMVESWRKAFGQESLPFYYVQVAPFFYDIEDPKMADYAFFREAQENISKLNNTEMVTTMDVGEAKDLHPKNKRPIGIRLANTALNRTYGFLNTPYRGPQFDYVQFEGNKGVVHFVPETVNNGLTTNDGMAPKFFQIAGEDQEFYPAKARIIGRSIEVEAPEVLSPVAVRYAFTNYPVTNLENADQIPAVPFRSDTWQEPDWNAERQKASGEIQLDPGFENLLIRDSLGVTGADGIISFPLNNGKSVFMMGDSFLSPVKDGKRDPKSKMINNTFIEVDVKKGISKSIYKGTLDNPESLLTPVGSKRTKEYYWPGHGFEEDGILHVFMSKFVDDESIKEGWKFKFLGTDYLRLKPDTYEVISNVNFPYTNRNGVHYGHSILRDGTYTYIYGAHGGAEGATLQVARAVIDPDSKELGHFEFFDGSDWNRDEMKSGPLKGIHKNVPEQFSVFKYNDKYVLLMQERNLMTGDIYSYIADAPTGPWRNERLLFHTTEQENNNDGIITYNAMAHPQYIKDNKLLVSYCVNSLEVSKIHEVNVDYYRPKFIWIPMEMIVE